MKEWKRIEPTTLHKVGWRSIVTKTFLTPDNKTAEFDTIGLEGEQCVGIIAVTTEGKILICKQYRVGPEKIMYEIPGGFVDKGESPSEAASRELLEETGYGSDNWEYLGLQHKGAYTNTEWHFFLATDCVALGSQRLDDHEHIDIVYMNIDELIRSAKNGLMTDSLAVLMAYDRLLELNAQYGVGK